MTLNRDRRYRIGFWILLGAVTLLRLGLAARFGLSTDESHYVIANSSLSFFKSSSAFSGCNPFDRVWNISFQKILEFSLPAKKNMLFQTLL